MLKYIIYTFALFVSLLGHAQTDDARTLQETAKSFARSGDYANAIMVLEKASEKYPQDVAIQQDLVFYYYLNRSYTKAMEKGKVLVERPDADVTSYQMLGLVYKALEERKECEKLYKKGIKTFPNSGVLYSEYGELLWSKQDPTAIQYWEKGISVDPNYSGNYYQAAKFYAPTKNVFWALIYGEIFVNLESYSKRTAELKTVLLESYKNWYAGNKVTNSTNGFVNAVQTGFSKTTGLAAGGLDPEVLTRMRTRFILDWFESKSSTQYPFRLFEYHQQLLRDGNFDAYNQWLFGVAQKAESFQNWISAHQTAWQQFNTFQKNRVFKLPNGQYYQQ
jgi:tetratricopeptide (TPR) repeat protein